MLSLKKLAQRAGRVRLPANAANDVFWLAGASLVATGAAIERLSAGFIVAGALLLVLAIGGSRAR